MNTEDTEQKGNMDAILTEIGRRLDDLARMQREDTKGLRESIEGIKGALNAYMVTHATCLAKCEANLDKLQDLEKNVRKLDTFQSKVLGAVTFAAIVLGPIINRIVSHL